MRDSALERWDEIAARLAGRAPVLFVDYDGTVSPIAPRPDLATLPEPTREVLRTLSRRIPVAVVSGRERENVAALVGLPGVIYVGNHGFDIAGPGLRHEAGDGMPERVAHAAAELSKRLAPAQGPAIEGLLIEPKRFSISVHFRLVDDARVPEIERAVDAVAATFPDLRKAPGKKHLELRPRIDWDKGRAVLWILDRLEAGGGGPWIPLYLGDDVTDEDAFRAIAGRGGPAGRGVGILVGDSAGDEAGPRPTAATYTLRDTDEARVFLERLAALREAS